MPLKDEVIAAVRAGLDQVYEDYIGTPDHEEDWSLREWTRRVKTALCRACRTWDEGCYLGASDVTRMEDGGPANGGEWLFDVTCLQYDDEYYQKRVVLAAECEWNPNEDEMCGDFEKLLVVRAEVRVMIFDGDRWGTNNHVFARYICRSKQTQEGDTYLLAGYTSEGFEYVRIDALQSHTRLD